MTKLVVFLVGLTISSPPIDLSACKTKIEFSTRATGGIRIDGHATESPEGKITLEGSKLNVNAHLALNSLDTGIELRNRHLKEKYLELSKWPKAEITFSANFDSNAKSMPFEGTTFLHGVSRSVTGTVSYIRKDNTATFLFTFAVSLKEHGIITPSFLGITVNDEVKLRVEIVQALKTNEIS